MFPLLLQLLSLSSSCCSRCCRCHRVVLLRRCKFRPQVSHTGSHRAGRTRRLFSIARQRDLSSIDRQLTNYVPRECTSLPQPPQALPRTPRVVQLSRMGLPVLMLNISFYAVDFSTEKLQNVLERQKATAFPEVPVSFRWPTGRKVNSSSILAFCHFCARK